MFNQDNSIIPDRCFSPIDGHDLFISHYQPHESNQNGIGILFCDPILEEKQDSRRALANWANYLAQNGYNVLCFDFRGQGESTGMFSDFTPEDAFKDIEFCFRELKDKKGVERIGFFGMRYGCNLAARAAIELKPDFMILWGAMINGGQYADTILRANLTTQLLVHRKVITNRKTLVEKMRAGETVNIDGYDLSLDWYTYMTERDIAKDLRNFQGALCLLELDPKPQRREKKWNDFTESVELNANGNMSAITKCDQFWKLIPRYIAWPDEPIEKTMEFLNSNAG
ncbi:MAG: alpha/beta fold hydrolase [candidate division Zixibacteria bacterium]